MSYCRFSSNDFQCDLYIYEDVSGGFTTHIAGNRIVYLESPPEPMPPFSSYKTNEAWAADFVEHNRQVMALLDDESKYRRDDIDLPYAGESFNDPDIPTLVERLLELKALGYRFPDSVITDLREEHEEKTNG